MRSGVKKNNRRLYKIWQGMRQRCNNPNDKDYDQYGGRGIKVCAEWDSSSEVFINWALQNGYADDLSIDRRDVNGNYCPEKLSLGDHNRTGTKPQDAEIKYNWGKWCPL